MRVRGRLGGVRSVVIVERMVGREGGGSLVCMSVNSTIRSLHEPTSQHCAHEAIWFVSPGIRPAVHSIELRLNRREPSYPSATIFRSFIHGMYGTDDDAPVVQNATKMDSMKQQLNLQCDSHILFISWFLSDSKKTSAEIDQTINYRHKQRKEYLYSRSLRIS